MSEWYPCKCGGRITWAEDLGWWECDGCDFAATEDDSDLPEESEDDLS